MSLYPQAHSHGYVNIFSTFLVSYQCGRDPAFTSLWKTPGGRPLVWDPWCETPDGRPLVGDPWWETPGVRSQPYTMRPQNESLLAMIVNLKWPLRWTIWSTFHTHLLMFHIYKLQTFHYSTFSAPLTPTFNHKWSMKGISWILINLLTNGFHWQISIKRWEEEAKLSDPDIEVFVSEVEVKKDRLFGGHSSDVTNTENTLICCCCCCCG